MNWSPPRVAALADLADDLTGGHRVTSPNASWLVHVGVERKTHVLARRTRVPDFDVITIGFAVASRRHRSFVGSNDGLCSRREDVDSLMRSGPSTASHSELSYSGIAVGPKDLRGVKQRA